MSIATPHIPARGQRKFGLAYKISFLLTIILVASLAALSYKFITTSHDTSASLLKEYHVGISDEVARAIGSSVEETRRNMEYLSDIFNDADIPPPMKLQSVQSVIRRSNAMDFLAVYDERGKLLDIQKPRTMVVPREVPDSIAIDSLQGRERTLDQIVYSSTDSLPYIRLIVPWIKGETGGRKQTIGYLLTLLSLKPLSAIVEEISRRRFGDRPDLVYVVDEHMDIVAHADRNLVRQRINLLTTDLMPEKTDPAAMGFFHRDLGVSKEYHNIRGIKMLASLTTISTLQMGILVEEPADEAFAAISMMTKQLILWSGAGILLSIIIGIIFARTITRPIRTLVTATHGITGGNYGIVLPLSTNDEVAELTSSFNKMSEDLRKTFEELREANEHIVNAEKMVLRGEIVAEVSHEIKNFLQVLMLHAEKLQRQLNAFDQAGFAETLGNFREGLKQMKSFSDNLLVRSGSQVNLQPMDVADLLTAFTSFIRVLPKFKKGKIEIGPLEEGCIVSMDSDQMRQVLLNLANNAIEASPTATLRFSLELEPETMMAKILLTDNGPGIAPEICKKLFSERITTKKDGHGYGLPICKKIVESQKGTITVTSAPGEGATFTISFPLLLA